VSVATGTDGGLQRPIANQPGAANPPQYRGIRQGFFASMRWT
jgi:hypothetical protein